jgi:hypothetical protein
MLPSLKIYPIMTIKTYRTTELKGLSLQIFVDGDTRTSIVFKSGCTLGSTATYTTSNPKIQKALESLGSFGTTFYLEKESVVYDDVKVAAPKVEKEAVQEEEKEVVDILDAQTFKNLVELRNSLQDKGIDVSQVTNVKAAEALAKKNGYNYTVEKNA